MAPDIISPLASLQGLTLEQIAALDTTDEILRRIVPECPAVDTPFNSAI
jgi:hypothetical protein